MNRRSFPSLTFNNISVIPNEAKHEPAKIWLNEGSPECWQMAA